MNERALKLPDNIRSRIQVLPASGSCWIWTGQRNMGQYGTLYWDRKQRVASRLIYELLVGPVPDGLELDHLCRVRHCVNPDHLEPVTRRENVMRGIGVTSMNARKTHCMHGHEFTTENTYLDRKGQRSCKTCLRRTRAEYKARLRESKP